MWRNVVTLLLLLAVAARASMYAGATKELKAMRLAEENVLEAKYAIPEVFNIGPRTKLAGDPSQGAVFGTSDYDYGWNNGSRKMVESYFPGVAPGTRAQFTFMERDLTLPAPADRRAQAYVYYDGSTFSSAAAVRPKATGASGFGDISVYRDPAADGFAVVTGHVNAFYAINFAPGDPTFTEIAIPTPRPTAGPRLDPSSFIVGNTERTYVVYTGDERTDLWVYRTDDFGTTWRFVDSLLQYGAVDTNNATLDVPIHVRPNGDIYIFAGQPKGGALPPLGTATPATADRVGFFKSTNAGVSWAYVTVIMDGQNVLANDPDDYFLPENFEQFDGLVDANGVVHMVFNGYAVHQDATDTLTVFRVLYWNSSTNTFVDISSPTDTHNPLNGVIGRSGNAFGRCYPTLAYDPTSNLIFAAWSEPQIFGTNVDSSGGRYYHDVWYSVSHNSGTTWSPAVRLTTTTNIDEVFTTADIYLTQAGTDVNKRRAHLVYLADSRIGSSVFGQGVTGRENWIYHTIDFPVTSVDDRRDGAKEYMLSQNYPNPFNPSTRIEYTVPEQSNVSLTVYNLLGQQVATLVNGMRDAGTYAVVFDAGNLASGVYFYELRAGSFTERMKMMLMK